MTNTWGNVMQCPKCAYVRQPEDTAPDYECPKCGIVYAKFDAAAEQRRQALVERQRQAREQEQEKLAARQAAEQARAEEKREAVSTEEKDSNTTACKACGGLVSWEAKTCPHCGQGKPAGKKPKPPMRTWAKVALWILGIAIITSVALDGGNPPLSTPVTYRHNLMERPPFHGSPSDIDAMTSYAVILGRSIACGVDTAEAARRVGVWMGGAGPTYTKTMMDGIALHAKMQSDGRSPDSCSTVRRGFADTAWP